MTTDRDKKTHIVIIDLDEDSCRVMKAILQEIPGIHVQIESTSFEMGFDLVKRSNPSIVVLNLFPSEDPVFAAAKKITKYDSAIDLFITSQQTDSNVVIRAMRAGAREFISQPVVKDELITAVKTVVRRKKQSLLEKSDQGKIMTFFGARGGVGTSTLVTNVATSLAKLTKREALVIDLNLQFGSTALMLNIKSNYSILDVATNIDNIDVTVLKDMLPRNKAGVSLLAPPHRIEEAESVTCDHVEQLLGLFKKVYDYILIDTNHVFDDVSLKAFDESDRIFLISFLDVPTVFNTKRCLELLQKIGYNRDKLNLVINRYTALDDIDLSAMEKLIDYPIFWRIPNHDFQSVVTSINRGTPITQMTPNSKLSQNILKMIKNLNGSVSPKDSGLNIHNKESILHKLMKTKG